MGIVQPDFRQFTKAGVAPGCHREFHSSQVGYEGRLSVVSESQVHQDGLQRYLVQARLQFLSTVASLLCCIRTFSSLPAS